MYSVIVGCSPQTGQSGSRRSATSLKVAVERVEQQQPADQRLADAERELERLVRLERADDAGQDAEHAALGARRRELRRRRLRVEAAVARALVGLEDRDLALEAVDRAVDDRDAVPDGGVVHEVARREVVGAVDDHVPAVVEDPIDVLGGEPLRDTSSTFDVRVQRLDRRASRCRPSACRACSVEWTIWRCRFDSSTMSASTMPSVPTPAAAR